MRRGDVIQRRGRTFEVLGVADADGKFDPPIEVSGGTTIWFQRVHPNWSFVEEREALQDFSLVYADYLDSPRGAKVVAILREAVGDAA